MAADRRSPHDWSDRADRPLDELNALCRRLLPGYRVRVNDRETVLRVTGRRRNVQDTGTVLALTGEHGEYRIRVADEDGTLPYVYRLGEPLTPLTDVDVDVGDADLFSELTAAEWLASLGDDVE